MSLTDQRKPKYHLDDVFDPAQTNPNDAHAIQMRLIPPQSRVLELGCSSGYLSAYIEDSLGCRVTGLDFDPDAIAIAQTRVSEAHVADLDSDDPLRPAKASAPYDVLYVAGTLEHLKHPERVLQAAYELLEPGATVIISLPNVAHWSVRWRLLMGQFNYTDFGMMDRTHLYWYTIQTGYALLQDQGYVVDHHHVAGSLLQATLNNIARRFGRPLPKPILGGLLGYEMILVAHRP